MFVIEGRQAKVEIREQREIDGVLDGLPPAQYRPFLRAMLQGACQSAGLSPGVLSVDSLLSDRMRYSRDAGPTGDIVFSEDHIFFLQPYGPKLHIWEVRPHAVASQLPTFSQEIEKSVRARIDGRRVRGMEFEWLPVKEPPKDQWRRRVARQRLYQEAKLTVKKPEYTQGELDCARALVAQARRDFLIRLSQLGKARTVDTAQGSDRTIADPLLQLGLLRKEYLVICRKDSHTICAVADRAQLENPAGIGFQCSICGRSFKEEVVQDIYAVTEEAKALLAGSRWMSIWVTDALTQCGLSLDQIGWSAAAGEDELDVVAEVLGLRIFFELKDREFGLGDAYPFSYRVSRYNGNFGVVVTTQKVAEEAKKFFQERNTDRSSETPIRTIETEADLIGPMGDLLGELSRFAVQALMSELAEPLGVNVIPVVNAWLDRERSFKASTSQ